VSRQQEIDTSANLLRVLLWQYNEAENLEALIQAKQDWFNANFSSFWDDWYTDVFNIETANDFGLEVWGIILGIRFTSILRPATGGSFWGFGPYNKNFNNGNFGSTEEVELSETQKRMVVKLRYLQLISRGTIPEINNALNIVFGEGVYCRDNLDMTITVVFTFTPARDVRFIIENYDLLPRPSAVELDFVTEIDVGTAFGFGPDDENFDHAPFGA